MQIKGNFDLTVVFTGVGIPTTLRKIDWPKASFAKASFSQFWSTIPSHACQRNKDMGCEILHTNKGEFRPNSGFYWYWHPYNFKEN